MRHREYCTEALEIDILLTHLVVISHRDLATCVHHITRTFLSHRNDVLTRILRSTVRQIEDCVTAFTDDTGVRIRHKTFDLGGMPVISTCTPGRCIESLLNRRPVTLIAENDVLLVQIVPVLDCVIVDTSRELTRLDQLVTRQTVLVCDPLDLMGCTPRTLTLATQDVYPEFAGFRIDFPSDRSQYRCGYA